MGDSRKQLTALNSDTLRDLINKVNDRGIEKDDILGNPILVEDSYYLLYYTDCK